MSVELKPCPFCGGVPEVKRARVHNARFLHWIVCGCGAGIGSDSANYLRDEVVGKWNRRDFDGGGDASATIIPCPFCGGAPRVIEGKRFGEPKGSKDEFFYWVLCESCGAYKSNGVPCRRVAMIGNWNVRVAVQQCLVIND